MPSLKRKLGDIGEEVAIKYLKKQGYQILERNYQKKWGEIDMVVKQNNKLIFIEVKTKKSASKILPEEQVGFYKQKRLIRTAKTYLLEKNYPLETNWQIDVIAIELDLEKRRANLRHIKNAIWER